jgi:hypothetical protein
MIPGSLPSLFFASGTGEWEIIDTWSVQDNGTGNTTMTFPNSLVGDMYICVAQSDNGNPNRNGSAFSVVGNGRTNSTGYGIFARVVGGNASSFTANTVIQDYNAAIFFTVRGRTSFTSTSSVVWASNNARRNTGTSDTPSHGNIATSYFARSLALLAVFMDDEAVPSSSWSPPSGATLIASDKDSSFTDDRGSVVCAYQKLSAAGNYSWGDWGQLSASNSNDWVTGIIEVKEP